MTSLSELTVFLAGITDLETSFMSGLAISFCLDMIYTILTYCGYFPSCLWAFSTAVKGFKAANLKSSWIGNTCAKNTLACAINFCIRVIFVRDTRIGDTYTGVAYFVDIENICIGSTYGSSHKPSKFSVSYSKLLVELTSEIPISSFLYLQVILDKILY